METVIDALKHFLGEYIVAAAVLAIAICWLIWWLSSKYHARSSKVDAIDSLPCKAHDESMTRISERLDETGRLLAGIESRMTSLPCKAHDESMTRISERLDETGRLLAGIESRMTSLPCKAHDESMTRISERLDETGRLLAGIESRMTSLPCKAHDDRHDRHEQRLNAADALLHKMEGQLELLVSNLIQKNTGKIRKTAGVDFSAKHSPRVLNDNGLSLLNDSGGYAFLDKHMEYFISKLEVLQPKTPLDVEDLAMALLQSATPDDMFIPLKNWVYNAPLRTIKHPDGTSTQKEVSMDDIIFVLSLPIRDKYLDLHPLL